MKILTKPLYISPKKEQNEEKYGLLEDQCICCGRPITKKPMLFVHLNTNNEAVHPSICEEDCLELTGHESHGCFPIGNDCANKMIGFAFTLQAAIDGIEDYDY